jgi:hypothetical protein
MPQATLRVGLKEWAAACRAVETGRRIVLPRKGGILEARSGFEIEHRRFLLFPTYLHQNPELLKPAERAGVEICSEEPSSITISRFAEVTDIIQIQDRAQTDAIADQHIWSPALIDNTPAYAGCKSWVPLDRAIDIAWALEASQGTAFELRRDAVRGALR